MQGNATIEYRNLLPAQLARLSALTQGLLASALSQCDMTIAHWRILICLTDQGPSTLNEIVDFTHLPQSTLSRSVARLEEKGVVTSSRQGLDRRKVAIEVTDLGRDMLVRAAATVDDRCNKALSMSPAELDRFKSMVTYILGRLS